MHLILVLPLKLGCDVLLRRTLKSLEDELADARQVGHQLQMKRPVIDHLKCDVAVEASVNGGSGQVNHQTESGQ